MPDVLALHGFTQRGAVWGELTGLLGGVWRAPDLPGHGATPPMTWGEAAAWAASLAVDAGVVVGYSMGGRLALGAALECPVRRLVLVSASAGITDAGARAARAERDLELADRIVAMGIDDFVAEWLGGPLFAGLGRRDRAWRDADAALRRGNDAGALAEALRLLGRGAQPPLADRLGEVGAASLVVAGALDRAGVGDAEVLAAGLPHASLVVLPGVGHAVMGEDPVALAGVVGDWLGGTGQPFTPEHMFD